MKRIGIFFIVLLSMISCSWVDTKTKEDIDKKVEQAKHDIVQAGEDQVKNAKARIEEEIASSVRKASDNIDTLVKASISQIEQATDKKIQQAIDKEVGKLRNDLCVAIWIALIGILLAILGLLCGILSIFKLRNAKLKELVVEYVTHSECISTFIKKYVDESKHLSKTIGVTQKDVELIVTNFIKNPKILESIADQINKPFTIEQATNFPINKVEQPVTKEESQSVQRFELYARDSNTRVLSDIFTSHQKGKTIYKLIMDTTNSTSAILDLCIDKEDAVGRILRFNNEDLEAICNVNRNSNKPEKVIVIRKGRAEKIGSSEWNVTEKVEIELS